MSAVSRLDLLKDGYKEVLDATKHQDDKMGRLLTAVAFLIGGSLALGALASAVPLGLRFKADDDLLPPLTLLAIVGFETCASISALLLLYGLTTPLRLPGVLDRPTGGPASQIYFLSIARGTSDAWRAKWSSDREAQLVAEQADMYVGEIYNLAVRTQFKYDRANEAVAVLSLGLLGFACAVPLAFSGASSKADPASFGLGVSLLVALLLAVYCFITQLTRVRIVQANTEDLRGLLDLRERPGQRIFFGRLNALALAIAAGTCVYADRDHTAVDITMFGFLLIAISSSLPTVLHKRTKKGGVEQDSTNAPGGSANDSKDAEEREFRTPGVAEWTALAANLTSCLTCAGFAITAISTADRSWSLLAAATLPIGVALGALVGPAASTADRRRRASG